MQINVFIDDKMYNLDVFQRLKHTNLCILSKKRTKCIDILYHQDIRINAFL